MPRRARRRRPPRTIRNRNLIRFRYRPQYGVIVICRDEPHQRRVFRRLASIGHECRVVVV